MIIAVNTRFLPDDYPTVYGYFIHETFKRIASNNPAHEFVFISEPQSGQYFSKAVNIKYITTSPVAQHPLLWKFWFDIKLPALLKKHKADVFVSCDGICSLATKVPQCLVLQDLAFLEPSSFFKKSHASFYQKQTAKFLNIAKNIVATSVFTKDAIIAEYNVKDSAIDVVYNAVNEIFSPISEDEKAVIKNQYSDGKEYFLYTGDIHTANNLINLLKAFSVFKKRQQTNMKLILAGKIAKNYQSFKTDLKSYKYRNDVVLLEHTDEDTLTKITGAAYGLINPSAYPGFVPSVLQAMKCNVPVITAEDFSMQEITNNSALYADVSNHLAIADKMMLLYKDENLRKELIQKAQLVASIYNWNKTANLLWQSILKACK